MVSLHLEGYVGRERQWGASGVPMSPPLPGDLNQHRGSNQAGKDTVLPEPCSGGIRSCKVWQATAASSAPIFMPIHNSSPMHTFLHTFARRAAGPAGAAGEEFAWQYLAQGISLESSSTKELYSGQESTQTTVPKPAANWKPESSSRIGLETVPCAALAEEQPDGMGDAARCPRSQIAQVLTASLLPRTTSPMALPQLSPEGTGAQGRDSHLHMDTGAAGPSEAT
ncbi:uncharacterized protein LOC125701890 [Lagopus muta]|uniref:uncharacterized protein LOC125701890 n=1 Tax=Lagopus muta TaxID=64668 RepID=UPI00209E0ECF|nr:uncharacterized protein LOC125701890 [Lagopus muta]